MFSIRVSAADVDWQIRLLNEFPDIADRFFKPAMEDATDVLFTEIEASVPSQRARAELNKRVTGRGMRLAGRVGWWGAVEFWQVNVLEYGAKAHDINSYAPGAQVYIGRHPGFEGKRFMKRADETTRQRNLNRFEQARDRTVSAMTVRGGL